MVEEELLSAPIHLLSRRIKGGKVSPVRLAEASLTRIERLDPSLHAFVTVTAEMAMREATQAEKELKAGLCRGPLHGIPYAVKDLFAVAGYPTTWGARPYARQLINEEATVVRKLRAAGAVLVGKCTMSEIAGMSPAAAPHGPCRTPWDLTRWSGGSSSGSASSVAAGFVTFTLGTETWGSIMIPSSFCGVTGLRPTFGRVSRAGAMSLSWTMDKVGVLCRDAKDAATVFGALLGEDPADLSTMNAPFRPTLTKAKEKLVGKRIGIVEEDNEHSGSPEVGRSLKEAARLYASMDARVETIVLPDHPYAAVASTIIAAEEASAFEPLVESGAVEQIIDPERRGEIIGAQRITAVDYLRCQRLRSRIAGDFARLFERYDVILGPSTPGCAPLLTASPHELSPGGSMLGAAGNLLGLPAVSVPCGFSTARLPLGMKIVGRTFAEADVLEAAHLYQTLTDWHLRRPDL